MLLTYQVLELIAQTEFSDIVKNSTLIGGKFVLPNKLRVFLFNGYSKMDPVFNEIFIKTVTGNFIHVYPAPENGKQPGSYAISLGHCRTKNKQISMH